MPIFKKISPKVVQLSKSESIPLYMWRGESSSLDVPRSTDLQCVGDGFGGG